MINLKDKLFKFKIVSDKILYLLNLSVIKEHTQFIRTKFGIPTY